MQKVIVIIPCYNEAERLPIQQILLFMEQNPDISFCFVNDGSTDGTSEIIEEAKVGCPDRIETLHLEQNSGKGEAIRQGMLHSFTDKDYQWFAYWDADLATPLIEINRLLKYAQAPLSLLLCSRVKRLGATIKRHLHRHILGRIIATMISCILDLPVYDTQCGAKLIRRDEIQTLFSEKFISTWLFDVEIIARLQMKHSKDLTCSHILEVPVKKWQDISGSKLKFRHMFFSLFELVRINRKYNPRRKKK